MIFGAGINQLELIREAKRMGLRTVVVDPSSNPPGRVEADLFFEIAGDDYDTTRSIAIEQKVNGIVTGQMEKPLRLMAKLAADQGYFFNSVEVVEKSLNKWMMKRAFLQNDVPCAKGIILEKDEEISQKSIQQFKFPLIIKPVDSHSSRGVYRAGTFHDLIRFRENASTYSSDGKVIIEEFLAGKEYSVESITFNGETHIIQFTEKFITPFPRTVEMGHLQPAGLSNNHKQQIEILIKNAISAIGIDNSASHAEIVITEEGPKMIEIGARLGGDFIASYLTKVSTGISMDKAAIQIAIGETPVVKKQDLNFAFIKYFKLKEGSVIDSIETNNIHSDGELVFFYVFVKQGDEIPVLSHSSHRSGCVLVEGKSREIVISLADKYEKLVKSQIKLK